MHMPIVLDHSYTLSGVEEMPKNTTVEAECTSLTNSDGHHSDNINLKSGDDEEFDTVEVRVIYWQVVT